MDIAKTRGQQASQHGDLRKRGGGLGGDGGGREALELGSGLDFVATLL